MCLFQVVKDFAAPGGLGVQLHSILKERAKAKDNWVILTLHSSTRANMPTLCKVFKE